MLSHLLFMGNQRSLVNQICMLGLPMLPELHWVTSRYFAFSAKIHWLFLFIMFQTARIKVIKIIKGAFFNKIPNFCAWANKLDIWGIFGRTISTHFGTVSPLSMFSIIQPLFLQKPKPFLSTSQTSGPSKLPMLVTT